MTEAVTATFRVVDVDTTTLTAYVLDTGESYLLRRISPAYDSPLQAGVEALEAGNTIEATVVPCDAGIGVEDLWNVREFDVHTETVFAFIDDPPRLPNVVREQCDAVVEDDESESTIFPIRRNEDVHCIVSVFHTEADRLWNQLRLGLRSVEPQLQMTFGDEYEPPYEILFFNVDDGAVFVSMQFLDTGTELAETLHTVNSDG